MFPRRKTNHSTLVSHRLTPEMDVVSATHYSCIIVCHYHDLHYPLRDPLLYRLFQVLCCRRQPQLSGEVASRPAPYFTKDFSKLRLSLFELSCIYINLSNCLPVERRVEPASHSAVRRKDMPAYSHSTPSFTIGTSIMKFGMTCIPLSTFKL